MKSVCRFANTNRPRHHRTLGGAILSLAILSAGFALGLGPTTSVYAQQTANGYLQSSSGTVRSGFGLCWRTGYWTKELATEECDPNLVPKKAAAEPVRTPAAEVQPRPAPVLPPKPVIEKFTVRDTALFDFDRSDIRPDGKKVLDGLLAQAKTLGLEAVIVVGHADWTGPEAYNQKLSERRAASVKNYLAQNGISTERIQAEGRGETQPIADNKTREGRAKNRRVEIEIVGSRERR